MPSDRTALDLPARSIPVPASISAEAQAVLAAAANAAMQWAEYPAFNDKAGWLDYRKVADGNMMLMLGDIVQQLPPHPVSTIEAGPARAFKVDARAERNGRVLLSIHGGALVAGGGQVCEMLARLQAAVTGSLVIAPDYRMPPEHPFPAALDDCLTIYRNTIELHAPANIVVHGMSAGSNLAAALLLRT